MLTEEQLKKIISLNESLQVQLADVNAMLASRENEIEFLNDELAAATELRSRFDEQKLELESINNKLGIKEQQAIGAEERELELHQELTEMARLNKKYNDLISDYTYLQTQLTDVEQQLTALHQRNIKLQQATARIAELESTLESTRLENDGLKARLAHLEAEKK
ncbi:MAG: hypothetical protein R2765_01365 [Ferruginibacter sp.]|nr:hypothetical protein [Bacteroidota bacterium]MBX2918345.1 hypothetical protein [Ferruginibacter sp.]MCB0708245.1 hypothetical protein [Chitinophagaceae bacterium]MCC7377880.1 hypothetical protein [Chitinophagaceae bacterium]